MLRVNVRCSYTLEVEEDEVSPPPHAFRPLACDALSPKLRASS